MSELPEPLARELRELLGDAFVTEGPDLEHYAADRCVGPWSVRPAAIAMPGSVEHVQALVRASSDAGVAVVPSGGRTGLAGGATATAGELVVSLERMRALEPVDVRGRTIRCEAGATVASVQSAAAEAGLSYPVDWAASGTAQIGGSIATNAGGIRVLRYGLTRDWVRGLEVVLADGELLNLDADVVKNNTGYDLRQLFVGSEGTLGIVVRATMSLCAPAAARSVALCGVPSDVATGALFERCRQRLPGLSAFEMFDHTCVRRVLHHRGGDGVGPLAEVAPRYALVEVESEDAARAQVLGEQLAEVLGEAAEAGDIVDAVVAAHGAQARSLWAWREDISESLHAARPHKSDVCLPVRSVPAFLEAWRRDLAEVLPDDEGLVFGHVGDGNVHLNVVAGPSVSEGFGERVEAFAARTYALVGSFGGSISAEHGVGLLKRDHLHHSRSARELAIMRGLKAVLDPKGLMNPGKIFE